MRKILIVYNFRAVQEDQEFSYTVKYDKFYDDYRIQCNLPFMGNNKVLVESPTAKPYSIPLPVGIKKCFISVRTINVSDLSIIGSHFIMPSKYILKQTGDPNLGLQFVDGVGLFNFTNLTFSDSSTVSSRIATGVSEDVYSDYFEFPVKYGKSPNTLFSVDGSGQSISVTLLDSLSLPTDLFDLYITEIQYGGVPSPDY